ncbi:MAG TPA: hypothetical protein VGX23_05355 [Actinocrinis sp.]|nr:hypothetical protein [Actinocrinis sp.]
MDIDIEERRVPWTAAAADRLDRLARAVPVIASEPMTVQLLARMSAFTGVEPLSVEQVAALRRGPAAEVDVRHLTEMAWVYLLDADHLWDEQRADDLDAELAAMAELHRRGMVLQPCTRWGRPPRPTTLLHMVDNAREIDRLPDEQDEDHEAGPRPPRRWTHVADRLLRRRTAAAHAA